MEAMDAYNEMLGKIANTVTSLVNTIDSLGNTVDEKSDLVSSLHELMSLQNKTISGLVERVAVLETAVPSQGHQDPTGASGPSKIKPKLKIGNSSISVPAPALPTARKLADIEQKHRELKIESTKNRHRVALIPKKSSVGAAKKSAVHQRASIEKFIAEVVPGSPFLLNISKSGNVLVVEFQGENGPRNAQCLLEHRATIAQCFQLHAKVDEFWKLRSVHRTAFCFARKFKETVYDKCFFRFSHGLLLLDDVAVIPLFLIPANEEKWPELFSAIEKSLRGPRLPFRVSSPPLSQVDPELLNFFSGIL